MHKIFNEWQAKDYSRQIWHGDHRRPAGQRHGAGQGARLGGPREHHHPAGARQADSFPYKDAMRCPIHVDDIAEVFARVLMTDKPKHAVYNSGDHDQPRRPRRDGARVPARREDHLPARTGGREIPATISSTTRGWCRNSACSTARIGSACGRSSTRCASRRGCRRWVESSLGGRHPPHPTLSPKRGGALLLPLPFLGERAGVRVLSTAARR